MLLRNATPNKNKYTFSRKYIQNNNILFEKNKIIRQLVNFLFELSKSDYSRQFIRIFNSNDKSLHIGL